jgi:endonuclease/exonuclease/phosphatase family metal-dependent hydrolase
MDKHGIEIYSWNVLNSKQYISFMSWKRYVSVPDAKAIAKIDEMRQNKRFENICNVIQYVLTYNNTVKVFALQEVNSRLLQLLHKKFNTETHKVIHSNDAVDDRVLIIDRRVNIVTQKEFGYNGVVYGNKNRSVLLASCELDGAFFDIVNLHIHWNIPECQLAGIAAIIEENLVNDKYVLCGDFNNNIEQLDGFLNHFSCITYEKLQSEESGYNVKLDKDDKIDHIMVSSTIDPLLIQSKTISKLAGKTILYNFKRIMDKFRKNKNDLWSDDGDLSDHKIVAIRIKKG